MSDIPCGPLSFGMRPVAVRYAARVGRKKPGRMICDPYHGNGDAAGMTANDSVIGIPSRANRVFARRSDIYVRHTMRPVAVRYAARVGRKKPGRMVCDPYNRNGDAAGMTANDSVIGIPSRANRVFARRSDIYV